MLVCLNTCLYNRETCTWPCRRVWESVRWNNSAVCLNNYYPCNYHAKCEKCPWAKTGKLALYTSKINTPRQKQIDKFDKMLNEQHTGVLWSAVQSYVMPAAFMHHHVMRDNLVSSQQTKLAEITISTILMPSLMPIILCLTIW